MHSEKKKNTLGLPGLAAKEGITTRRKSPALSRHPPQRRFLEGPLHARAKFGVAGGRTLPNPNPSPPRLRRSPLTCWNASCRAALPAVPRFVNPFLPTPLPAPALGFADRVFFGLSFGNFRNFWVQAAGEGRRCRGGRGRGRGRSTDADPLARSPARRIDQITTPPETFQWPTRPPQTEKKRHGNRKDTTILHWTPLGLALSCAGERMARDSHRHNACVRPCVFQSSHGIFVFPDVYW